MQGERGKRADTTEPGGDSSRWVVLGRVSGLFGVKGWVKVFSDTAPRENILGYSCWYLKRGGEWQPYDLLDGRRQGKAVVARLEGCNDRDQAAELIGTDIAIPRDRLPPTQAGEYYWTDLQGLRVETLDGIDLGKVDHLFETGANDVLVAKGDRQRLIPFIDGVIDRVDLETGLIRVDWDPEF